MNRYIRYFAILNFHTEALHFQLLYHLTFILNRQAYHSLKGKFHLLLAYHLFFFYQRFQLLIKVPYFFELEIEPIVYINLILIRVFNFHFATYESILNVFIRPAISIQYEIKFIFLVHFQLNSNSMETTVLLVFLLEHCCC